jgi:hypothetical protein
LEKESSIGAEDLKALREFQTKALKLERALSGTLAVANDLNGRLKQIKQALDASFTEDKKGKDTVRKLENETRDILRALQGDNALRARNENTLPSTWERVGSIIETLRYAIAKPTTTQREAYRIASEELTQELAKLRAMIDGDLKDLEKSLDLAGAPWTTGRLPDWKDK